LRELVDAYERRYHRHLRDQGIAAAIAHHDPQGLDKAFQPSRRPDGEDYDPAQKWW
jgi:hypothetical protein